MSASVGYRRRDANASDAIAAILHPDEGFREKQQRKGVTPRDFERENKLRVKKLQAENRERRRREDATEQQEFKLTRFKSVRPRVFREDEVQRKLSQCSSTSGEQGKKHEFLRRGGRSSSFASAPGSSASSSSWAPSAPRSEPRSISRLQSPSHSTTSSGSRRHIHRKSPVPSLRELERRDEQLAKITKKERVDFVNANAWEVIKKAPSVRIEEQQPHPLNRNFGRIPRYLLERKEQWAREEEERRKNAPDPDCPPGMVLLDEDERVLTLNVLQKSLTEAQLRMNTLPLRIETLSQIRRKNELESKLQVIEDAIKVFDRAKVYVAAPLGSDPENNRERTASIAA
ncbi:Enkurin domain-containing protein 1 [Phytophthora pseudosyringae]|uniref:Enkurin domain-containing protein 1 n=1 Tax=Phytophthora pseudosyringae TaxID=221518 RepID=A0A8T1WJ56_9STRA|nr:Enkurin domain-containing protein 1 [Phytophthora pseudosyringae]